MLEKLFVEKDILNTTYAQNIINKLTHKELKIIDQYDKIFGKVKKPYLQKRTTLNGFIAKKKELLLKKPPALMELLTKNIIILFMPTTVFMNVIIAIFKAIFTLQI